jgi:hypothetical protein
VFSVEINLSELENFERALAELPTRVDAVLVEAMQQAEELGYSELTKYAEPPDYPIKWDSEKQRRAFFQSSGFGSGIPHQRQGALPDSFEKSAIEASEGLIQGKVYSIAEWAKFVMGEGRQSNIHVGRWKTDAGIAREITPEVIKLFNDALLRAVQEALSAK